MRVRRRPTLRRRSGLAVPLMPSTDCCASCAPLVAAPRSLRQRCAPLVGSGSTVMLLCCCGFTRQGCSVHRFAGAEALRCVGRPLICCTKCDAAESGHLPSPSQFRTAQPAIRCMRATRAGISREASGLGDESCIQPAQRGSLFSAAYHESTPRTPLRGPGGRPTALRDPQEASPAISPG